MSRYSRFGKPSRSKVIDKLVTQRLAVTPASITGDYPSMVDDYQRRTLADPRHDLPVDVDNNTPWMGTDGGTSFPHWHSGETYGLLHLMHGDTGLRAAGRKPDNSDVFTGDMETAEPYGVDWTKFRYHTEARRHQYEASMISGDSPLQITDVPTGSDIERDHIKFKLWSRNNFIPPGVMYTVGPTFSSVANMPDHLNHYLTDKTEQAASEYNAGYANNIYSTAQDNTGQRSPIATVDAGDGSLTESFSANPYSQIDDSIMHVSPVSRQRPTMEFAHADACNTTSQAVITENMRAAVEKAVSSAEVAETLDNGGTAVAVRPDMLHKLVAAQTMTDFQRTSNGAPMSQAFRPDGGQKTSQFVGDADLDDANIGIAINNGFLRKLMYSDPAKVQKLVASEMTFNAPDQLSDANVRSISNERFISLTKSNAGVQYHMNGESLNAYTGSAPLIPATQQLLRTNNATQNFNPGQIQTHRGVSTINPDFLAQNWNTENRPFDTTEGAATNTTYGGARQIGTTGMTGTIATFTPTVESHNNTSGRASTTVRAPTLRGTMVSDHVSRFAR